MPYFVKTQEENKVSFLYWLMVRSNSLITTCGVFMYVGIRFCVVFGCLASYFFLCFVC